MFDRSERNVSGSRSAWQTLLTAVLTVLFVLAPVGAQTISSTLLGTVTDPSGTVVPKASVIVTNENTGDQRTATTDQTGNFSFASLLPGSYAIKVEATGFKTLESKNNR